MSAFEGAEGRVRRWARALTDLAVGDRVMGLLEGHFRPLTGGVTVR